MAHYFYFLDAVPDYSIQIAAACLRVYGLFRGKTNLYRKHAYIRGRLQTILDMYGHRDDTLGVVSSPDNSCGWITSPLLGKWHVAMM